LHPNIFVRAEALTHKLQSNTVCISGSTTASILTVRQHLVDVAGVGGMNLLHFFQAAHPVGFFGAQQVPFAGMHAHHFSRRRDLKPLGGAAMRLELEFLWLFSHENFLSEILLSRTGFSLSGFALRLREKLTG
jgi:hypothetical protein